MIKDSKERYNYDKLKILVEKCNTLKEILLELDLLPVTTNYRKIKSMLEKYNLELVYRPIYQQNKTLKTKYTEIELRRVVENSHTYTECFDKLGIRANYQHLKKNIEKYGIDISHFNQYYNYGNRDSKFKADLTSVLKENSTYSRKNLKKRLYDEKLLKRECCLCGQGESWNGMKISLILDHINGIYNDNRLENLRIVCPNCNAGLETFAGKNTKREKVIKKIFLCKCGNTKTKESKNCEECYHKKRRRAERPPLDELIKEVEEFGYCATGRKYGVSDNAIRKWMKMK
jgi:5-methylcytosine-specific restriction endonuclease McrA